MGLLLDLTGQKINKWTVVERFGKGQPTKWRCVCECGNERIVWGRHLKTGNSQSCGCSKRQFDDILGKRFGKLTVIKLILDDNGKPYYECRCDCGNITTRKRAVLLHKNKGLKTCGECFNRIDLTGQKFGRLTVLGLAGRRPVRWKCLCECGTEKVIEGNNLRNHSTKSCGCLNRERISLPHGEASFNDLLGTYKRNASSKQLEFTLTKDEFRELTSSNCFYCGAGPSTPFTHNRYNSYYIYNGIDRVDNNKGYTKENSVPCCFMCNYSKGKLSQEEFLSWIRRLCNYWRDK